LAGVLQRVADDELHNVMVFEPPRHGKSEEISRLFSAYYLYCHPDRWVGINSYAAALARTLSRASQEAFTRTGGVVKWGAHAVDHWETLERGGLWAAGVGGPITGKGFNLGIIDDPLKNAEDAASETIREKQKDWYRSTFSTRAEPGAATVIVQTRWHEDDLSGWLLTQEAGEDEEPEHWYIVSLAAIAEPLPEFPATCTVHPDWRAEGEPLCPERYPLAKLTRIFRRLKDYFFGALYQQRPVPRAGGMFKREWWQEFDPEYWSRSLARQIIQVWDTAFKVKKHNDYSVCSTWALMPAGVYVLDVWREKVEFPELKRAAKQQYDKWQPSAVLVEDKASGQSLIQELQRDTNIPIIAVSVDVDKVARAAPVTPYVEARRVFLPKGAPWVADWIDEHAKFSHGVHDDQVDTTSMALRRLVLNNQEGAVDDGVLERLVNFRGW
jgi:predicted phage terminase large subunit-like protein